MYRVPTTCACLTHWCYNTCVYILVSIPYLPRVLSITQTEHSSYITIPILIEKNIKRCLYTSAWWLAWTHYSHQCSHPTSYMIFNARKNDDHITHLSSGYIDMSKNFPMCIHLVWPGWELPFGDSSETMLWSQIPRTKAGCREKFSGCYTAYIHTYSYIHIAK